MSKSRPILICGHESTLSTAIRSQLEKVCDVEVLNADEAKERVSTFSCPEPIEFNAPLPLEYSAQFTPPLTRRERRAQNRMKH